MMFTNEKKKKNPAFAIALGAFAAYGVYSMVSSVKECCTEKCKALANMMRRKEKPKVCEDTDSQTDY